MNKMMNTVFAAMLCLGSVGSAHAALYTTDFGTVLADPSDCDDCFSGPVAFSGASQSINFFGTAYNGLFVGSNGYLTFGSGASNFSSAPLNTQSIAPMIAGSFTDLDSRTDALSNVYVNTSTAGQIVVTYDGMGHYDQDYTVRSTFQILVRSDQYALAPGEGQIGFFYGEVTDTSTTSAGFGDGLSASNPGELALASLVSGSALNNRNGAFFTVTGGIPVEVPPTDVPEPGTIALLGLGLLGFAATRRKSARK